MTFVELQGLCGFRSWASVQGLGIWADLAFGEGCNARQITIWASQLRILYAEATLAILSL